MSTRPGGITEEQALDCYMKGALWTWFEGGPNSNVFECGNNPSCGEFCPSAAYCDDTLDSYDLPCSNRTGPEGQVVCYAGRGAVQLSWNYNYGTFARWLQSIGITNSDGSMLDLINHPNLIMTKMDPPLSILASLWFYMTPGSGVPSMHDVIIGNWAGQGIWKGSVFGPTSKIINNECSGETFGNWWETGGPENNRGQGFWECSINTAKQLKKCTHYCDKMRNGQNLEEVKKFATGAKSTCSMIWNKWNHQKKWAAVCKACTADPTDKYPIAENGSWNCTPNIRTKCTIDCPNGNKPAGIISCAKRKFKPRTAGHRFLFRLTNHTHVM